MVVKFIELYFAMWHIKRSCNSNNSLTSPFINFLELKLVAPNMKLLIISLLGIWNVDNLVNNHIIWNFLTRIEKRSKWAIGNTQCEIERIINNEHDPVILEIVYFNNWKTLVSENSFKNVYNINYTIQCQLL